MPVKSHVQLSVAPTALSSVILSVTPWLNDDDAPFVTPVARQGATGVSVPTDGLTVNCPPVVSTSAPSVHPAPVGSLKSYVFVPPSDHVVVGPPVAAMESSQPGVAVVFETRSFWAAAPSVAVTVWHEKLKLAAEKLVDGLTTGTPAASTISAVSCMGRSLNATICPRHAPATVAVPCSYTCPW